MGLSVSSKTSTWARANWHLIVTLPFIFPLLLITVNFILGTDFLLSAMGYFLLVLAACATYFVIYRSEKKIYPKGDVPTYNAMFFASLLMIPFVAFYNPTSPRSVSIFALMDVAIIVATSVYAIAFFSLDKKNMKGGSVAGFLLLTAQIVSFTILSMGFFAFDVYLAAGFILNYLGIFSLFCLIIYMVQMLARRDGINLKRMILEGK